MRLLMSPSRACNKYSYTYLKRLWAVGLCTMYNIICMRIVIYVQGELCCDVCVHVQINAEYDGIEEGETIMRTLGDSWVVTRKSGHRRFFVVLNQKSANFAEINGESVTTLLLIT